MATTTLAEEFAQALEKVSGTAHLVNSLAGAGEVLRGLLDTWKPKTFAVGSLPGELDAVLREYAAARDCEMLGPDYAAGGLPMALDKAEVGITLAAFGIAETGTVAEVALDDAQRLVSAMPRTHVALVYARDLVPTLRGASVRMREIFERHGGGVAVSFISGPSRTGDIEMVLTLGVHGPETAHVIVVGEASQP